MSRCLKCEKLLEILAKLYNDSAGKNWTLGLFSEYLPEIRIRARKYGKDA